MTSRTGLLPPDLESGEGDQSPLPAFVIDTTAGALVAANSAGWQAWGLAAGDASDDASGNDRRPVALDQAMPALARLQAAHSSDGETLTFWTARGLLHLRCRVAQLLARGRKHGERRRAHVGTGCESETENHQPAAIVAQLQLGCIGSLQREVGRLPRRIENAGLQLLGAGCQRNSTSADRVESRAKGLT